MMEPLFLILVATFFSLGFVAGAVWAAERGQKIRKQNNVLLNRLQRAERANAQYYGSKARKLVDDAV
jgi:hypothetical protein